MKTTGRARIWLRAAVLWGALCVAAALLGPGQALGASVEVDAQL